MLCQLEISMANSKMFFNVRYFFHGVAHTESYSVLENFTARITFLALEGIQYEMKTSKDRDDYPR